MKSNQASWSRNSINFAVDSIMFGAFLVALAPHFTGLAIHEWLGLAFAGLGLTHVLLHWQWVIEISRRFFGKAQRSARINYVLNMLLFIDITVIVMSGIMISEVALPTLGLQLGQSGFWRGLHGQAANLFLPLVGLHVALHWQWLLNMFRRLWGNSGPTRPQGAAARSIKEHSS